MTNNGGVRSGEDEFLSQNGCVNVLEALEDSVDIINLMPGFSSIVSYEPSSLWYRDVSDFTGRSSMNGMVWCGISSWRMNAISAW